MTRFRLEVSLTALILAWLTVSLIIFVSLVGDRQWRTEVGEDWCGDLFMVTEESEEGFTYTCTDDYGDD